MGRLSKRVVDALQPGPRKIVRWDTELRGFGVAVTPSGIRSYLIDYTVKGRRRRMVLGRHGPLTCEAARRMALERLAAARGRGRSSRSGPGATSRA